MASKKTLSSNEVEPDVQPQKPISSEQVRQMMQDAQKMIEERKRMLNLDQRIPIFNQTQGPTQTHPSQRDWKYARFGRQQTAAGLPPIPVKQDNLSTTLLTFRPSPSFPENDKNEKDLDISKIREHIQKLASSTAPSRGNRVHTSNKANTSSSSNASANSSKHETNVMDGDEFQTKPVPLLLDELGRPIDNTGKAILLPTHRPTLKANIRAQKRAEFRYSFLQDSKSLTEQKSGVSLTSSTTKSENSSGSSNNNSISGSSNLEYSSKHHDHRLACIPTSKNRWKKGLKFNDPGKYVTIAHRQRMQLQLAYLQSEIEEKARTTGISTAARLARLSGAVLSSNEKNQEYIPQMEWWDQLLFDNTTPNNNNNNNDDDSTIQNEIHPTYETPTHSIIITNLIEHPIELKCPTDPIDPVYMPIFLTKKERKKLRRQNRREAWKEQQEKVRLGMVPAPQPKLRISNLMRVLGVEAVQDPTKVETHVKKQMALRLKTHQEINRNRKLSEEQKKAKKIRKLQEDTTTGISVCVYRIDDLSNQSKKFKVETNAKQLYLTGCILLFRECNLVIVEGGPKQQKKYRRLMFNRIKWDEDVIKGKEGDNTRNSCAIVWEGTAKKRNFRDMKFKIVQTEEQAREYFQKHHVQHYWDSALSQKYLNCST